MLIGLPLRAARGTLPVGLAFAALAAALTLASFDIPANFARLAAAALLGWYFLLWFETVGWVVLVACVIPWVDAYSVWRGPTRSIVNHHEHVFTWLSFAFPVPGERAAAHLGLPDLLFFALFLAAAAQFHLRIFSTWAALVASLAATIALATWLDLNGLPALPGLSLGFLLPNIDLLWHRWRSEKAASSTTEAPAP
jgi:hypothetical protein